jgi:GNAT superfamily N-acetyltransferase
MSPEFTNIRFATKDDAEGIDRMLRALAALEGTTDALSFSVSELQFALSTPNLRMQAVVAEYLGQLIGCVTFTKDFAIWSGGPILRIDDVYVEEPYRGAGIGKALMGEVAAHAVEQNASVRWEIENDNHRAKRFYLSLGVVLKQKTVARWSVDAMRQMRNSRPRLKIVS